ncbi:unnamed protein product [Strongylus vulgaris]|uniref:Uncharacterized protein n=1 Tax=Strongylus vulgaris TaxID=40348 RepID=A0A3P7J6G7_STRVU|nr:unnamed protein product [Strongylus vulgaris]
MAGSMTKTRERLYTERFFVTKTTKGIVQFIDRHMVIRIFADSAFFAVDRPAARSPIRTGIAQAANGTNTAGRRSSKRTADDAVVEQLAHAMTAPI